MFRGLMVVAAGLSLSGCAVTAMDGKIAPAPQFAASNIGAGREVGVTVADERPRKDLGRRAAGGGAIRMDGDLSAVYQTAIMQGLSLKGFAPIAGQSKQSNLRVEIRSLSNDPSVGLWTVGADIDSSVKGYAINPPALPYENLYRASSSNRTLFVSGAKSLNDKLNDAVNATLVSLFNDQKLMEVLAAK